MYEATKTKQIRPIDFESKFLQGSVLDIGAGEDLICPWAIRFDKSEGDANDVSTYFAPESFNTVHSSHTLEHMFDPARSLVTWWGLVKPGGYLVLVVPDEKLYEQDIWPSIFNIDHKASFRFSGTPTRPASYNLKDLCLTLKDAKIISYAQQDSGLKYSLLFSGISRKPKPRNRLTEWVARKLEGSKGLSALIIERLARVLVRLGYPIDQTRGGSLAQIEIVLQKMKKI